MNIYIIHGKYDFYYIMDSIWFFVLFVEKLDTRRKLHSSSWELNSMKSTLTECLCFTDETQGAKQKVIQRYSPLCKTKITHSNRAEDYRLRPRHHGDLSKKTSWSGIFTGKRIWKKMLLLMKKVILFLFFCGFGSVIILVLGFVTCHNSNTGPESR